MPDLLILALRYGGCIIIGLCLIWGACAVLMFEVDMRRARYRTSHQRRLIKDLFGHLTGLVIVGSVAAFCITLSFVH